MNNDTTQTHVAVAQCRSEAAAKRAAKKHAHSSIVHEPEARGMNERWIVIVPKVTPVMTEERHQEILATQVRRHVICDGKHY